MYWIIIRLLYWLHLLLFVINCGATIKIDDLYLEKVLKNVNATADPCEDFYAYACGNWYKYYDSEDYTDMPGYMDHMVNKQLLEVLKTNQNSSGVFEKVWQHFQSCESLTDPALNYYLRLVEPELDFEWPIFRHDYMAQWNNESNFDWLSTVAKLRIYGLNGVFLTQNINVRLSNGSHHLLELHQHQPRLDLKLEEIEDIFKNFGLPTEERKNITERIIALETQMKNLTMVEFVLESEDDDKRYKESFQELTIEELSKTVPKIDWIKYFSILLGREIDIKNELVQTFALNVNYFEQLSSVLQQTSNETICYYIMLKFMYHLNDELPTMTDRTIPCVKHLRGYMSLAMNFLYEEHYYKPKRQVTDAALFQIFDKLRLNFKKIVHENFLNLDQLEQNYILEELSTMKLKIGNIPANISHDFLEFYYKTLKINSTNFYANHLQLNKFYTRRQQAKLQNQPVPPTMQFYEHDPATASSSSPIKIFDNVILVPYGYLQLPLFDPALNSLFQYSLFGFIIAHEIIHAYDLFHIVYDQYGNYNETGVAVAHHFWKHVNCFARHPSDSLSENIADVAGLRLVFQAYFNDLLNDLQNNNNENENEISSKFSNFTVQQLFFINSVQFLCANIEKISILDSKILNLEHDMHDVRVQRNWANFDQLTFAFKCDKESVMNPAVKCRLW